MKVNPKGFGIYAKGHMDPRFIVRQERGPQHMKALRAWDLILFKLFLTLSVKMIFLCSVFENSEYFLQCLEEKRVTYFSFFLIGFFITLLMECTVILSCDIW